MFKRPGSRFWWISINGVRTSSRTADKKEAAALEARLTHEAWEQARMGVKPTRSWEEAGVRYLQECKGTTSYTWKVAVIREWTELLGNPKDIRTITRDRVDGLLTPDPAPTPRNNTLNHKVAILHNLLAKACEEWEWIERTPKFRVYPIPESKDKWLTPVQAKSLFDAMPDDLRAFCTLALATGLRSGKIVSLEWSQYDAARRILNVSGKGNKRANPIPLNRTAVAVLEGRRKSSTVHFKRVFPEFTSAPIQQRWHTWEKVRKLPGLEGVGVHTLRHTFNSWLAQAGVPKEIRTRLMGHAKVDQHEVYTHFADQHLRPAVEVIDRTLTFQSQSEPVAAIISPM